MRNRYSRQAVIENWLDGSIDPWAFIATLQSDLGPRPSVDLLARAARLNEKARGGPWAESTTGGYTKRKRGAKDFH